MRSSHIVVAVLSLAVGGLVGYLSSATKRGPGEHPNPTLAGSGPVEAVRKSSAPEALMDSEREELNRLRADMQIAVANLVVANQRIRDLQAKPAGVSGEVRDEQGRRLFTYDTKNRVITYDPAQSVVLAGDGKVFLNRRDEIAGGRRSMQGEVKATLKFENERAEDLFLFWIDYEGKPIFWDRVKPGATSERGTYMTHQWVVTDMNGNLIGNVEPELPNTTEVIPVQ